MCRGLTKIDNISQGLFPRKKYRFGREKPLLKDKRIGIRYVDIDGIVLQNIEIERRKMET